MAATQADTDRTNLIRYICIWLWRNQADTIKIAMTWDDTIKVESSQTDQEKQWGHHSLVRDGSEDRNLNGERVILHWVRFCYRKKWQAQNNGELEYTIQHRRSGPRSQENMPRSRCTEPSIKLINHNHRKEVWGKIRRIEGLKWVYTHLRPLKSGINGKTMYKNHQVNQWVHRRQL